MGLSAKRSFLEYACNNDLSRQKETLANRRYDGFMHGGWASQLTYETPVEPGGSFVRRLGIFYLLIAQAG